MNMLKHFINAATILSSGAVLLTIGVSIMLSPVHFFAANGIVLTHNASLLNEIRAPAGLLITSGFIILTSLIIKPLRAYGWFISSLVYLSYGSSRLLSLALDGIPHHNIIYAAVIELALGLISLSGFLSTINLNLTHTFRQKHKQLMLS